VEKNLSKQIPRGPDGGKTEQQGQNVPPAFSTLAILLNKTRIFRKPHFRPKLASILPAMSEIDSITMPDIPLLLTLLVLTATRKILSVHVCGLPTPAHSHSRLVLRSSG